MLEFIVVSCNHDLFNYDVICSASVAKAVVKALNIFGVISSVVFRAIS